MSLSHTVNIRIASGSIEAARNATVETSNGLNVAETLAAAKAGTLTTRTDANTGVATMSSGHGIATNDVCDIYWTGGRRYGMTATVATNAVTLDGGSGDDLPAQGTAVTVQVQQEFSFVFTGDNAELLFLNLTNNHRGHLSLYDAGGSELEVDINESGIPYLWTTGMGTNPVAGDSIVKVIATHSSSTASCELQAVVAYEGAL